MPRFLWRNFVPRFAGYIAGYAALAVVLTGALPALSQQQTPAPQTPLPQLWTWDQVKSNFEIDNPTVRAGFLNIDELKAEEITANLRPNPGFSFTADGTQVAPSHGVWAPFAGTDLSPSVSQLFERRHKRGLRYDAAKQGTAIGAAQAADTERTLLFNLRSAFVGILQAKAVLHLAQDNLGYYDKILKVSRDRFEAGDIAQIALDRLALQRLQSESDLQNAILALPADRRTIDSFDDDGTFDFSEQLVALDDYRSDALKARPDLRAAVLTVEQAETNYKLAEA